MTTKSELAMAYERGAQARRNGLPRTANPYRHRGGTDGEILYDKWQDGWDDEHARRLK